jgi:hypothetical protein
LSETIIFVTSFNAKSDIKMAVKPQGGGHHQSTIGASSEHTRPNVT